MNFTERCKEVEKGHEMMRPVYAARALKGERFAVPREGKEPVDVILHLPKTEGPHPVFLNMHGGGFSGLDAVVLDDFCQLLCDALGMFVINVNYQKAPEKPYPYAIREVCDTACYFRQHAAEYDLDTTKFALGGASAGGSIAAGAALLARDEGQPFACQLLIYPCTDLHIDPSEYCTDPNEIPAYQTMIRMYLRTQEDSMALYASPAIADMEKLEGNCPAIFVISEKDSLRPQGEAYARKLIEAGVPVAIRRFKGAVHGFVEVNRRSFFHEDERQTPEQAKLARDAEHYIMGQLRAALNLR